MLVDGSQYFSDPTIFVSLIVPTVLITVLFGALLGPILFEGKISFKPVEPELPAEQNE